MPESTIATLTGASVGAASGQKSNAWIWVRYHCFADQRVGRRVAGRPGGQRQSGGDEAERDAPDHEPTTTRSGAPFAWPAASRYSVVADGATSTEIELSAAHGQRRPRLPRAARRALLERHRLSAPPRGRTESPAFPTTTVPAARDSESTPTLIQVERSPSARRTWPALNDDVARLADRDDGSRPPRRRHRLQVEQPGHAERAGRSRPPASRPAPRCARATRCRTDPAPRRGRASASCRRRRRRRPPCGRRSSRRRTSSRPCRRRRAPGASSRRRPGRRPASRSRSRRRPGRACRRTRRNRRRAGARARTSGPRPPAPSPPRAASPSASRSRRPRGRRPRAGPS